MKELKRYILRITLIFVVTIFFSKVGQCESSDTTIYFFKFSDPNPIVVNSLDEADYYRLIIPATGDDKRLNVQEFYKNGQIKLIGKQQYGTVIKPDSLQLDGDCITYYPNGKKQSIAQYKDGKIDGDCLTYFSTGKRQTSAHYIKGNITGDAYWFYPNGKLYCCKKYTISSFGFSLLPYYLDCYDKGGNQICNNGNGDWVLYNETDSLITMEGKVKNGSFNGVWQGYTHRADSIKYTYIYESGTIIKGTGYDKYGKAYPFKIPNEFVNYSGDLPSLINSVKRQIKSVKNTNDDNLASIDTMHVCFIIEKNSQLSQIQVLGTVQQNVKDVIIEAIKQGKQWTPAKYFGIPFRTQITLPLNYSSGFDTHVKNTEVAFYGNGWGITSSDAYEKKVNFKVKLLDF